MDTTNTNSGSASVESQPSAPNTSPATTFGDDVPNWVKTAGLTAAHEAAGKPATATPPVTTTPPATTLPPTGATPPPASAQPAGTAATPPTTTAPVPPTAFDEGKLAQAIAQGIRAGQPVTQPAGPSDAELAKQLGIYTATPEVYKSILGVEATSPEQVTALNNALQGVARQAVHIAQVLNNQSLKEMESRFLPYIEVIRNNEATRVKTDFFKSHTDLTGYEPLVKQTYEAVLASGQKFASVADAGKFVADRTREMLKSVGITPTAPAAPVTGTQPRTTTPPARTMSPTSMGGRSGGSPATKPTTMQSVWG